MIPSSLEEWTVAQIYELVEQDFYESEYFDFKEMLPAKQEDKDKQRMIKTCCAFANGNGGFLVFGIMDKGKAIQSGLSSKDRLVGIPSNIDLPEQFGNYPKKCIPTVFWHFRNPPLPLDNGNFIHIVFIPRSIFAPHCFEISPREGMQKMEGAFCFPKRTNKGNEVMSYEEIRIGFLQFHEKLIKLQLLKNELLSIVIDAGELIIEPHRQSIDYSYSNFELSMLDSIVADTFSIISNSIALSSLLSEIRRRCRRVNNRHNAFLNTHPPLPGGKQDSSFIYQHNIFLQSECVPIREKCKEAIQVVEYVLKGEGSPA